MYCNFREQVASQPKKISKSYCVKKWRENQLTVTLLE